MKRIVVAAGTVVVAGAVGLGAAVAYADQSQTPTPTPTSTATGLPKAPGAPGMPHRGPWGFPGRLPAIDQMLHGEAVGKDANGAIKNYDWQNGQVTAVAGSSVTVRSSDGTTWTWTLNGDTKVRKNENEGKTSDVKTGDKVIISGLRTGNTRTASVVADPPPDFTKMRQRMNDLRKNMPHLRQHMRELPNGWDPANPPA